jgi:hypothetical protein
MRHVEPENLNPCFGHGQQHLKGGDGGAYGSYDLGIEERKIAHTLIFLRIDTAKYLETGAKDISIL